MQLRNLETCFLNNSCLLSSLVNNKIIAKARRRQAYLTRVHKSVDGDAFFPDFDENDWIETWREDHLDHDPPYSFLTLFRK